jgi:hypothetical protein
MASLFQIRRGIDTGSLENGELYYNQTSQSLQIGSDSDSIITLAKLNEQNIGDFDITGNLIVSGNTTIIGNLQFGSTSSVNDTVTLLSEVSSSIVPYDDLVWNLGDDNKRWERIFANTISASAFTGSIYGMGDPTSFSTSVDSRLVKAEWTGSNHETRVDILETAMSGSNRLYVSPEGDDDNDGTEPHKPFKTIKAAVESLGAAEYTNTKRYTIFVGSGNYTEQNPIAVPPGVAIVGDTLRTVRLTAANPTKDFFHVHDSNYFYGLRFLDLQHPAFAFSFPCSTANATISGGSISTIDVIHSVDGYTDGTNLDLGIIIEGPDASGSMATATADVVDGVITQINVVAGGTNYTTTEKPHISIPAPASKRPFITTSPYIQNCSSITGPFNTSGVKVLQQLPYDEVALNIDEQGAGGGLRIDGNLVHTLSPLESFVADAFTQVNQGGPGHLVINKGYAQFVSCFTTFCTYGFKVVNGGFANISNSVIDFGKKGLVSKTYYPQTYNTAVANESKYSSVTGFEITQDGAGYTGSIAGVTLTPPDEVGTQATAEAVVSALGTITSVYITDSGSGYTTEPLVSIDPPTGAGAVQADATALISGVTQMKMILSNTTQSVEISSNMILDGENYLVTNVQTGSSISEKLITTYPNPPQIESGSNVYFHKLSNISTGGLVMEYVGSGVTYNALPKFGGVPDRTKEINEFAPGRIFYSTVDNIGNLKIGEYFAVDQLTGEVTIDARNFNLSGINQIGPFRRNGISVGKILREVSDSVTLVNSQGVVGSDTVPTQYAVYGYVNNYTSSTNDRLDELEATASNHENRVDILEASQSAFDTAIVLNSDNVTILGNLTVQGTQTSLNTTEVFVEDLSLTLASGSVSSIQSNGAGIQIAGADVTMSWNHTDQRIELNKDFAVTGSISSSTIVGIGNVTLYSQSVDSRLIKLETTSSNFDDRLDNLETISASYLAFTQSYYSDSSSFDSRSDLLEATASYLNTTFSTSVNSRLSSLEADSGSQEGRISALELTSQSLNQYTASVSTSVGLLQEFSGSEYKNDSSSFDTRVSASTLTFNDTVGQSGIEFTHIGTQVSAIASGLTSGSNVHFNDITASGFISSSKTIYCDTLVANTLATSGSAVNSFSTNGTFGSVIIKDSGSKAIKALDNANFDDSTFSITGSFKVSGSISSSTLVGIGNVSEFSTSVDSRLDTIELSIGGDGSLGSRVSGLEAKTGSYATTGSNSFNGSQYINGDITASNLYISGAIYTYELHSIIESSSVFFSSGSNQIGDNQTDVLTITGSIYQTGSTLFSELSGSLFAFSASLNSRFNNGGTDITTLSSSIYQTDSTQSNNITITSASAWGAFQSASSYSASIYTRDVNQDTQITTISASAWGAFQSASSYSSSFANRLAGEEFKSTTFATTGSNTFTANQIISGSLNVTGDVVAYSTSDERLKDNIQLISNPIQKVNELRGVEFDWKDGMPKAGQHDYGVIAQDVIKVMPELVNQRHDGYYAVDYDKMIGLLIEVVKEQEKRIKELENKIG